MHTRVLRQDAELCVERTGGRRARRPPRLDSFVGRDREVAEVCDLLDAGRLVTLTGPGGSGKTRLAEEVAAEAEVRSGIPTAVVELAPVEDLDLVPGAIGARLGLTSAETLPAVVAQLADRPLLLVLDNLEQLTDVGPAVTELLRGTMALRILATSRESLRVAGEHVYPVDPLPVPAADERDPERLASTPSVALLLDRTRSRGREPGADLADGAALRDVVRTLDGLPLALEIVAPRLAALGPAGLLEELGHALDLTARQVDPDERHRTLRSTIAWSHDRLTAPEQRLLRRLSVLRGGGDLDAVRAVGGDDLGAPVLDVLVDLLERNMVQRTEPVDGSPRFRLLETVRQFAGERLDDAHEAEAAALRVADHFASWAVGLAAHSEAPDAEGWLARALADADNLRAAMDTLARAGRVTDHLQLVVDAAVLWLEIGLDFEGERRLRAALDAAPTHHPARAMGLVYLAVFVILDAPDRARAMVEEAVDLARSRGDEPVLALALTESGGFAEDEDRQREIYLEAAAIAERTRGSPVRYSRAAPDYVAGNAADGIANSFMFRDVRTAIQWQRRAVEYAERGRNPRVLAWRLGILAMLHLLHGDVDSAGAVSGRARALINGVVEGRCEDLVAFVSGRVLHLRGDVEAAAVALRNVVDIGLQKDRMLIVYYGSFFLVDVLVDLGELVEADAVLARAEELLEGSDNPSFLGHARARRARLSRLTRRTEDVAPMLEAAEKVIDPGELSTEHIVVLVEHALLTDDPDESRLWVDRLEDMSRRTGVMIPPWERRLLAVLDGPALRTGD
jgi:predicted ATPase